MQEITAWRERDAAMLFAPIRSRKCAKRDEKPAIGEVAPRTESSSLHGKQVNDSTKKTERTGNVYENKGPLWKTWERPGNVYENKGSYPFDPGML